MKNTMSEMKSTLEGINSRLDEAEDWINHLEDKIAENIQSEQQKRKRESRNNEDSLMGLWDNNKHTNICEQGIKNLFEKIMMENFPNLVKEIDKSRKHRESQTRWIQTGPQQDM